ncbi:hypothetical protein BH20CHL5_BH20CHL5_05310 [soil metagenome]
MTDLTKPDERVLRSMNEVSSMALVLVEGQEFENQTVYLDGRNFEHCTFRDCKLVVLIGRFTLESNTMYDSPIVLDGPAAEMIKLVDSLSTMGSHSGLLQ